MSSETKKVVQASLLVLGFVLIWALPLLPASWIYNRLAIRAAFGHQAGPPPAVSVTRVEKPHTVTFSNGVVADVGSLPAGVSNAFHLIVALVAQVFYIYKFRRPIRMLMDEAGGGTVTARRARPL